MKKVGLLLLSSKVWWKWNFKIDWRIHNRSKDFQSQKTYLPTGTCSSCCVSISKFRKKDTPVKTQSSADYLSIANKLRNLPLKTRNSKSEVECSCTICLIARSKYPYSPSSENVETPKKCVSCFSPIGRGHKHSPNSCQLSLTLLDNLEKQVPPHLQEQFGSRIINKAAKNWADSPQYICR